MDQNLRILFLTLSVLNVVILATISTLVNYGRIRSQSNIRMETIGFQILAVLLIVARGSIKVKNGVTNHNKSANRFCEEKLIENMFL